MLGRYRIFKFTLLQGQISREASALLLAKATRPVATSVLPEIARSPVFEVPVKHLHTLGGCVVVLKVYSDHVTYESSDRPSESRYWRYADIQNFSRSSHSRFEISTFEDKFGGPTRSVNFQLKQEFPEAAYDYLWLRLNSSDFYAWQETASKPKPPSPSHPTAATARVL